jgi:tRNA (guanine-N7-)-methyltransferase
MNLLYQKYSIIEFENYEEIEVDVGCGKGTFTMALAGGKPKTLVLAIDIISSRLKQLEKKVQRGKISNIKFFKGEAAFLLGVLLPDDSINKIHLICPDPWPKAKHRAHRLINSEFSGILTRVLKNKGIFHFASDDDAYCVSAERVMNMNLRFSQISAPPDIPITKSDFEKLWLSHGKEVKHFFWKKK